MAKDNDPVKPSWDSRKPTTSDFDEDDSGITPAGSRRREPVFSNFDESEGYEEPDRDTDYAAAYEDEDAEADELDDFEIDESSAEGAAGWQLAGSERKWQEPDDPAGKFDASSSAEPDEEEPEDDEGYGDDEDWDDEDEDGEDRSDLDDDIRGDSDDDWDDPDQDGDFSEEVDDSEEDMHGWPLGLIAVALVALLLLAAGGYGVIQQRSAMQEEILELQASLATAASPAEVTASREALREMEQRSRDQVAEIRVLSQENSRLSDMVTSLEAQLKAQQDALAKPAKPTPKPVEPKPVAKAPAKAPVAKSSTAAATGDWFVNFGSYNSRAVAQEWANRLQPGAGKVVVSNATKAGDTFYRVRVVGLSTRDQAEGISRQLEARYGLPKLWVGLQ